MNSEIINGSVDTNGTVIAKILIKINDVVTENS